MLQFQKSHIEELRWQTEELSELHGTLRYVVQQQKMTAAKAKQLLQKKKRRVKDILFQKPVCEILRYLLCAVAREYHDYKPLYSTFFCTNRLSLSLLLPALDEVIPLDTPSASTILKIQFCKLVFSIHSCRLSLK